MTKPKTLEDFPHFLAEFVSRGIPDAQGYTRFEYRGKFDRKIPENHHEWFYLLFGQRGSVCATLQSLDSTHAAVLTCDEKDDPDLVGKSLAYLGRRWSPHQVWMVAEPRRTWKRKTFEAIDAVAADVEAKDVSVVEGREVKLWTKLEPARQGRNLSRYYPASDQATPVNPTTRIVPLGWDHEHCELCGAHVTAGTSGYHDPSDHWLCEGCYEKYVVPHDLVFVDEL